MKKKYQIPKKKFNKNKKEVLSLRLPGDLINKLDDIARNYGLTTPELLNYVLDQFAQQEDRNA